MRVLAIDPGERIGWAHADADDSSFEVTGHGISFIKEFALKLHEVYSTYDVVIYEEYRITAAKLKIHTGSSVPTLQVVGMIRLCSWLHPQVKLVRQTPTNKNMANRMIAAHYPDIQRKLDGLPKSHDDSHDGDALRHLAFWRFNTYA